MSSNVNTTGKTIKIPGPDHPITIEHTPSRVVVTLAGRLIADTRDALTLRSVSMSLRHLGVDIQ